MPPRATEPGKRSPDSGSAGLTGGRRHHRRAGTAKVLTLVSLISIASIIMATSAGAETSMLDPGGPRASRIADIWWIMLAVGGVVFVVVMALLVFALLRARRRGEGPVASEGSTRPILIGVSITTVIVIGLVAMTFWGLRALANPDKPTSVTIEVVGHQYWWEVRYPDQQIVTANELHIPAGQPVSIKLTSDDVIHSFWVPNLAGKLDLIPGRTNQYWIEADTPGVYVGECAEFCGLQHALMQFRVVADTPDTFATWLSTEGQPAAEVPADSLLERGQQVFFGSACVYCHAIRGTAAASTFGPDLTHFASRHTIAAGALDNNRGNLAAWIIDPQTIKLGNQMPGVNLTSEELEALVAYLESLK